MNAELNTHETPPGGWQFFQPQTKWWAPNPIANTHGQQVVNIIKHRRQNPAMMLRYKLSSDPAAVGEELLAFNRARLGIPDPPKSLPPAMPAPRLPGAVQQAVAAVKKMATGAAILLEWDQSGLPPVAPQLSEQRALLCSDCPKNEQGKSLSEYFTVPAAELIKRRFERLEQMNLKTTHDAKLNVCQACLCPLRLKVHCPMELILKRLKPEQKAELDPRCWILLQT